MQSYNPAIPGCTFSRLLNGPAKHVNKKNAGKARVLLINVLQRSPTAFVATFRAVALYCYL